MAKPLSNAERQKRWRDKRNELAKQAEAGLAKHQTLRKDKLVGKLELLIEGLFVEGAKDMATMSPGTVAVLATRLERLLVEYGAMPESKRWRDPQGHVRELKAKMRRYVTGGRTWTDANS
jgi:hypothetical protein